MDERKNALVGAAMMICAANEIGWRYHPPGKSTSTRILVWPNKPGILPDFAQVTIDFRHPERSVTDQMVAQMHEAIAEACKQGNVDAEITQTWEFGAEEFDQSCNELVRQAARDLGVSQMDILSQAGHDAYQMTRVAPTALMFSPCKDGISHNESEHIELAYTEPGVNVLLHAVLARAST